MIRKFVILAIILAGLIAGYNLVSQILEAAKSGERLSEAADAVYKLENKKKVLLKELLDSQSPQFIEEKARNKLGLGKIGETIVIIPDEKINLILEGSRSAEEIRLPNPIGWWKVFF